MESILGSQVARIRATDERDRPEEGHPKATVQEQDKMSTLAHAEKHDVYDDASTATAASDGDSQVLEAVGELSRRGETLRGEVEEFLEN